MNIFDELIEIKDSIDEVLNTEGWTISNTIDEQMSLLSIRTNRADFSDEEISSMMNMLDIVDNNDPYFTLRETGSYNISLFYDNSDIILFIGYDSEIFNTKEYHIICKSLYDKASFIFNDE